jgi:hypothetical protein
MRRLPELASHHSFTGAPPCVDCRSSPAGRCCRSGKVAANRPPTLPVMLLLLLGHESCSACRPCFSSLPANSDLALDGNFSHKPPELKMRKAPHEWNWWGFTQSRYDGPPAGWRIRQRWALPGHWGDSIVVGTVKLWEIFVDVTYDIAICYMGT